MKYIKYSLIAALCLLMTQCTEEGDKTYPQQPAPQWSVVAEDFVSEVPAWPCLRPGVESRLHWQCLGAVVDRS